MPDLSTDSYNSCVCVCGMVGLRMMKQKAKNKDKDCQTKLHSKSRWFMGWPYFFAVKPLVTTSLRLFSDSLQSISTISSNVIPSVTSWTNLWWSASHLKTIYNLRYKKLHIPSLGCVLNISPPSRLTTPISSRLRPTCSNYEHTNVSSLNKT